MRSVAVRARGFGVAVLLAAGVLSACGGDASATEQICDARADLEASLTRLSERLDAGDTAEAQDAADEVRSAFKALTDGHEALPTDDEEAMTPAIAELGTALANIPFGDEVAGARDAVASVRDAASGPLARIGDQASCA